MLTFPNINPEIFRIGPIAPRWYSLMYLIGFGAAYFIFRHFRKTKYLELSNDQIDSFLIYCFWGLLIGARLFFVFIYNWPRYENHPLEIFAIWEGGLSFHGGLVGVIVGIILFSIKNHIPFFKISDCVTIISPIGIGFGRIGNFINSELYGRVTTVPWAIIFPTSHDKLPRHPSQLYESFFEGLVLFCILWLIKYRLAHRPGYVSCLFLFLYGLFRGLMENFREPDSQLGFIGNYLTMGQILCMLMMAGATILFLILKKQYDLKTQAPATYAKSKSKHKRSHRNKLKGSK